MRQHSTSDAGNHRVLNVYNKHINMVDKEKITSGALLGVIFSDSVLKSLSEYHEFLNNFTAFCLSDSTQNILLSGPAYDSLPPFYKLFDLGSGQMTARPSISAQYAFVSSKSCAALEDHLIEYNQEYKVLLYLTPAKEYDDRFDASKVILHVSSRTHSLVQREPFGANVRDSIVVRNDSHQVPKFHVSSLKYEECFQKSHTQLLFYQLPSVQLDLRQLCMKKHSADSNKMSDVYRSIDDTGLWHDSGRLDIRAMKTIPTVRCLLWPAAAVEWTTRSRMWPHNSLIQDVINSQVFLKPSPQQMIPSDNSQQNDDDITAGPDDLLWSMDFTIPESILLSQTGADAKRVFFLLQSLVGDSAEIYIALKHLLLWCMEEHGPDLEAKASGLIDKLMLVISRLESFMSAKGIPHYFIPESIILDPEGMDKNYVCHIFGAEKSCLDETLLSSTGLSSLMHIKDLTFCSNIMFKSMLERLYSAAEHNSRIMCMQLYQKLHGFDTVWKSIEAHHQAINILMSNEQWQYSKIHQVMTDFVHSSLGGMYFVQGMQAYYRQERRTFFSKAEEHFAAVQNSGMIANRLRKAMMLLKREKYQQTLDYTEELFSNLYTEVLANEMEDQKVADYETDVQFITGLENASVYAVLNMDYLVMKIEKAGLLKEIANNLTLAEFQLLGYTPHPVAVLDVTVLCGIIVAYSYSGLERYDDAKKALEKVEGMSLKDEIDLNERRGCFYLNVIAHAYKKAKDTEQAKYLLERSVAIMNSARNPGRWALISMNTKKMRDFLWSGIGVAMATTIAAVTINFMLNKK